MPLLDLGQFDTKSRNAKHLSLPWRPLIKFLCRANVRYFVQVIALFLGVLVFIGVAWLIASRYPLFFAGLLLCAIIIGCFVLGLCQAGARGMRG